MFDRFVALGDSMTEGLDDPDGNGGWRGWADRLAEQLGALRPESFRYANLAIRGRLAGPIHDEQLEPAIALRPDLAGVTAGLNDVLRPGFAAARVAEHLEAILGGLREAGATVFAFTLPDPAPIMPLARPLRPRVFALNDAVRAAADRTGAIVVELGAVPVAADPRFWSEDRLHANAGGHARIAAAAAHALGVPGADRAWAEPLPPPAPRRRHELVAAELSWARRHMLPWVGRRLRGASSGDGVVPKRPELVALDAHAS